MAKRSKPALVSADTQVNAPALASSLPSAPIQPLILPTPPTKPLGIASVPRWKRASDSRMRKKVAKILVLKLAGQKTSEIAKRLKTTPETVRHYLYIAGKNGWLSQDGYEMVDPAEQLAFESAHKVVRNISAALDGKLLMPQQFEMTIEAAKGTGLFKTHTAAKIEGQMQFPALEVKFEIPRGTPIEPPVPGSFGGVGNYVDGETIDAPKQLEGETE